jgi:hypothetical protein
LEFFLEGSDLAILGVCPVLAAFAGSVEGSGAILEELLLPEVEKGDPEVVLLADVGDRLLLEEMKAEQGDFLVRGKVTA